MAMLTLSQFADITDSADAWRYNMPVGSVRPEDTDPAMVSQPQAQQPTEFQRIGSNGAILTPGFKLALSRIFRLGGNRGTPAGPSLASPRLRRRLTPAARPIQSNRVITDMPAGLIDDTPTFERFARSATDEYLS